MSFILIVIVIFLFMLLPAVLIAQYTSKFNGNMATWIGILAVFVWLMISAPTVFVTIFDGDSLEEGVFAFMGALFSNLVEMLNGNLLN